MEPIIIDVAPNGAKKTTADLPNIPVTAESIAYAAREFAKAGAAMVHLHVRDDNQKHTLDPEIYSQTISAIREVAGDDLIIQCTSESGGIYTPKQQMEIITQLHPEAASVALREFIPDSSHEASALAFFADLFAEGILTQYVLYSLDEVRYFAKLRKDGKIPGKKVSVLFVLGQKYASINDKSTWALSDQLDPFLESFDGELLLSETIWHVCAFGGYENSIMQKVTKCGGNPRIGFENNHFLADGSLAKNNADLVLQYIKSVETTHREIATPAKARIILGQTLENKS